MNKSLIMTAAITGLLTVSTAMADKKADTKANQPVAVEGECHGVNACKGKGECGGEGHACAGKNSCKGKGWVKMTEKVCKEKGGKFVAEKM